MHLHLIPFKRILRIIFLKLVFRSMLTCVIQSSCIFVLKFRLPFVFWKITKYSSSKSTAINTSNSWVRNRIDWNWSSGVMSWMTRFVFSNISSIKPIMWIVLLRLNVLCCGIPNLLKTIAFCTPFIFKHFRKYRWTYFCFCTLFKTRLYRKWKMEVDMKEM